MVPPVMSIGQVNFTAYAEKQDWKTHDGKKIPTWDKLSDEIRAAWESGGAASVKHAETMSNKARRDALGEE